jgi:type II secretory pathway pseudopilin PulG
LVKKIKIKNCVGITLVEIIVVIFLVALFSTILIADFPKIKQQLALNRAAHGFAQDLKKTQDLGGSGFQLKNENGDIIQAKSFGIYVNAYVLGNKKYILYADLNGDEQYTDSDYVVQEINFNSEAGSASNGVIIKEIHNANSLGLSINFTAPNFNVKITDLAYDKEGVKVVFALEKDLSKTRIVYINRAGLIEVK